MIQLKIDPEFKSLIPPLTDEEYQQLTDLLLKEGCRDALITWNGTIIDGHNRYEICNYHKIEFRTDNLDFGSRDEAKEWIIRNQFGRRNLTPFQRAELALQLKPLIHARAKENQIRKPESVYQNSDKQNPKVDTYKEIAKIAGVSHDTIHKVDVIKKEAAEEVKQKVASGEMSIRQGYMKTRKKEDKPVKKTPDKPKIEETEVKKEVPIEGSEQSKQASLISIPEFQSAVNRFLADAQPYVFMSDQFKLLNADELSLIVREVEFVDEWVRNIKKIIRRFK